MQASNSKKYWLSWYIVTNPLFSTVFIAHFPPHSLLQAIAKNIRTPYSIFFGSITIFQLVDSIWMGGGGCPGCSRHLALQSSQALHLTVTITINIAITISITIAIFSNGNGNGNSVIVLGCARHLAQQSLLQASHGVGEDPQLHTGSQQRRNSPCDKARM